MADRLNLEGLREHLQNFEFQKLFNELDWALPKRKPFPVTAGGEQFTLTEVAALAGVEVFEAQATSGDIPSEKTQAAVFSEVEKQFHEHLLIFVNSPRAACVWFWRKREEGKFHNRPHRFDRGQSGELFLSMIHRLHVDLSELDEAGNIEVSRVAKKLADALDVQRVTKRFYNDYQAQHLDFTDLIRGVADDRDRRWYASVLLHRLMFIYFLQKKGFLDGGDRNYLRAKLDDSRERGKERYFEDFLKPLFFEGFAKPEAERSAAARKVLGQIPYLNGGLFLPHRIEIDNAAIDVPDRAFTNLLALFEKYSWNLNDTPGGDDQEINPDVLGYIFEKYINQKAFGAYYTPTEITRYLCQQTIHKLVLERVNATETGVPGAPGRSFRSVHEIYDKLDAPLCRKLLMQILPEIAILDPACGSGAFLVAAMKTLLDMYFVLIGKAESFNDRNLREWLERARRDHRSVPYFLKKAIITDNLYGVDIMEEACEITKLRLFLALVASAASVADLEPLPNIDFNILCGNSLVGLLQVEAAEFEKRARLPLLQKSYVQLLMEKRRKIETFRHTASYSKELRSLREEIDSARSEATETLDDILLGQFQSLGIQFEQATWDAKAGREGRSEKRKLNLLDVRQLKAFHWGYEFDEIFNKRGGFDVILTNPPWEVWQTDEKEFFQEFDETIRKNKLRIEDWKKQRAALMKTSAVREAWLTYASRFQHVGAFFKKAPQYRHHLVVDERGRRVPSKINLYSYFLEACFNLLGPSGHCGIVLPSGVYTDLGVKGLREMLFAETRVTGLFGFENRKEIFEGVHRSFKFVVLTFEKGGATESFPVAFMRLDVGDLERFPAEGALRLPTDLIRRLSPTSLALMEFKSDRDMSIAERVLQYPALGERIGGAWNPELTQEFNMTTDSDLFTTSPRVASIPLVQGGMFHQYLYPVAPPKYWIDEGRGRRSLGATDGAAYEGFRFVHRRIARNTDTRTMIAALLPPRCFCADTAQTLANAIPATAGTLLVALMNSLLVDWQIRLRVTTHCDMHFVYQLRLPRLAPSDALAVPILRRATTLLAATEPYAPLWEEVMASPWAPGCGPTDDAHRTRLLAEIDSLVAHLYGLTEEEYRHIVSTFPLVPNQYKVAAVDAYKDLAPGTGDPELAALLLAGEGPAIEFKSSLRWDTRELKKNADLERIVLKTVAGFLNADGGNLLIGVEDSGKAFGLAADFATLAKQTRDYFEVHLGNILHGPLGKDIAPCIQVSFASLDGKDICRLLISPSPRPVFMAEGSDEQSFYLRTGNATKKLNTKETLEYVKQHWAPKAAPPAPGEVREEFSVYSALGPARGGDKGAAASKALAMSPIFKGSQARDAAARPAKKAEEETDDEPEPRRTIDDVDRASSLCAIRDLFGAPEAREGLDRESALKELSTALGFDRLGPRIREALDNDLRTAVTRRILRNASGTLALDTRSIEDYDREELKTQLIAAVGGTWTEREDATRAAARRLGFARTGQRIRKAFAGAINGAIRQERLEASGTAIRKLK